jgi:hypothetical protein
MEERMKLSRNSTMEELDATIVVKVSLKRRLSGKARIRGKVSASPYIHY